MRETRSMTPGVIPSTQVVAIGCWAGRVSVVRRGTGVGVIVGVGAAAVAVWPAATTAVSVAAAASALGWPPAAAVTPAAAGAGGAAVGAGGAAQAITIVAGRSTPHAASRQRRIAHAIGPTPAAGRSPRRARFMLEGVVCDLVYSRHRPLSPVIGLTGGANAFPKAVA
jgi:hypothetical protein